MYNYSYNYLHEPNHFNNESYNDANGAVQWSILILQSWLSKLIRYLINNAHSSCQLQLVVQLEPGQAVNLTFSV